MKILISFVALLTISLSANAQKPITRNWQQKKESLVKLSYLNDEGTWASRLGVTYVRTTAKAKLSGTTLGDVMAQSSTAAADLRYGVTSQLNVFVSTDYLLQGETKVENTTAPTTPYTSKRTGVSDPSVGAIWRLFKNQNNTSVDLGFSYSPSLGKRKPATATETGNSYRGGDELKAAGILITEFSPKTEMKLTGGYTYGLLAKDTDGDEKDPSGSFSLGANMLHDLDSGLYIGGGATIQMFEKEVTKDSTGAESEQDPYTATMLQFDMAWDLSDKDGLTTTLFTVLPFTTKTGNVDYEYNQTLGLNISWIHQF